jgi:opacity protein-like surface antigen
MRPLTAIVLSTLAVAATAVSAAAQTVPPPPSPIARADFTATIGWFNANKSDLSREGYNDWYNSSGYGGIGAGWYWTDNHKTEIDFGATTSGDVYTSERIVVNGQSTYRNARYEFTTRKLTIGQQYQAYRNAWFHPHVAAGLDLTWETRREERSPYYIYDRPGGVAQLIQPEQPPERDVELVARPFAAVGFKAYMTPRAFFRSDMRFTFESGVDEVLLRFGFGVDF